MNTLNKMLQANENFVNNLPHDYLLCTDCEHPATISKYPDKQVAIYSCMDTRLVDFLEPALGIARGEAKIIKAAGNTITSSFDNIMRSLIIAVYELGVQEIFIVGHEDCGLANSTSEGLIAKMLARGVHPSAIHLVKDKLEDWVDGFHHPRPNIIETVAKVQLNPFIPNDVPIHGLLFCPQNGSIKVIINGYEQLQLSTTPASKSS